MGPRRVRPYSPQQVVVAFLLIALAGRWLYAELPALGERVFAQEYERQTSSRLKHVALALLQYDDQKRHLPPAAVCDSDGRPLLSWRVLLLPYLGEEALYKEFRLDEPWDSPHNRPLLGRMPEAYAPTYRRRLKPPPGPGETFIHAFVGKGTAFEGRAGLSLRTDFPDGLRQTVLVIAGGEPTPWTKPEDVVFAEGVALLPLRSAAPEHYFVAMADGSVQMVTLEVSEATLRAAVTRNASDTLGPDWPPD